jgi:hypothetical protein
LWGGGGGSSGGGGGGSEVSLTIKSKNVHQVRVPRKRIGDNLVQIKAMRLAKVQTFNPNVWRPNRVLSVPRYIDLPARADKNNGQFVCVSA